MRAVRRFRNDETGGIVLVEFGLILPILIFVFAAVIDFSRAYYSMNNLVASVREGARFASTQKDTSNTTAVESVVNNYWNGFGNAALNSVTVTRAGSLVTVRGEYTFQPFTALRAWNLDFVREATFRWERAGGA